MKTIRIKLSTESIQKAISKLEDYKLQLDEDIEQIVEILTNDGAEQAQMGYGEWAVHAVPESEGNVGRIVVTGDMPAIAEFGAGDATAPIGFEDIPEDVRAGSYSEQHSRQYADKGVWFFGGEPYTEVPGRHSLFFAKQHIMEHSTEVAREVVSHG